MAQTAAGQLTLPVRQAFVVQLSTETEGDKGQWAGRVEHVVSGQATYFHSVEELLTFMTRVLGAARAQPPGEA
jgi:hypothetical protein